MAAVYPENIPAALKAADHWVVWRYEERGGKATKPPWKADGSGHASATDPATWTTFERAYQAYLTGDYEGVGIVMTEDMGVVGVDLDKVEEWSAGADRILATLDSYTEITPSGNGYRVYVRGAIPPGARRKGHVEIYNHARFFTVSGDSIGRDTQIEERTEQLAAVHAEWLGRSVARPFGGLGQIERAPAPLTKLSESDSALLQRALHSASTHFAELWNGAVAGDHSAADLALCNYLSFWWGGDAGSIDRMFRCSGLMRDKWDSARGESTYGAWTIARALEGATEFYEPQAPTLMTANKGAPGPMEQYLKGKAADEAAAAPRYAVHNALELLDLEIPVARFAVPGLVTEGLNLLAGKPKMGKSWIALGMSLAISEGGMALGSIDCESGDVLYLALEDSPRRLQDRLRLLGAGGGAGRLTLVSAPGRGDDPFPRANAGGLTWIDGWLAAHPDARLVIIDTLALFRSPRSRNGDIYQEDYAAASEIKHLADTYSVSFLLIHHLNKGGDEDFVQAVSGSSGITGAADGVLVLERERNMAVALLKATGRDVEEKEYPLQERGLGRWHIAGEVDDVKLSGIRKSILRVLRDHGVPMFPAAVAEELGVARNTVKQRMWQMGQDGTLIQGFGGQYGLPGPGFPTEEAPEVLPDGGTYVNTRNPVPEQEGRFSQKPTIISRTQNGYVGTGIYGDRGGPGA